MRSFQIKTTDLDEQLLLIRFLCEIGMNIPNYFTGSFHDKHYSHLLVFSTKQLSGHGRKYFVEEREDVIESLPLELYSLGNS